jgi:hypothetical protein
LAADEGGFSRIAHATGYTQFLLPYKVATRARFQTAKMSDSLSNYSKQRKINLK